MTSPTGSAWGLKSVVLVLALLNSGCNTIEVQTGDVAGIILSADKPMELPQT